MEREPPLCHGTGTRFPYPTLFRSQCLIAMGPQIEGVGTSTMIIHGVERLHGAEYEVLPDRIETGTFLVGAAMTGGKVRARHARADTLDAVLAKLEESGAQISTGDDWIDRKSTRLNSSH